MNIKDALKEGRTQLTSAGVLEPEASAEVLLSDVMGLSRTELLTKKDNELSPKEYQKYKGYLKRRENHEPVWQIIGKVDFWGISYSVDKNVLVPRPETEILIKEVIDFAKSQNRALRLLDLGTGAGTIVVALKNELNNCTFFASDVSGDALKIAKKNAKKVNEGGEIKFKKGSLFTPWKGDKFDIICANLPYIPHEEMEGLSLDVYHHEPRLALDGGTGGLEIYERFLKNLPDHLSTNGAVFCEIGIDQGDRFKDLVKKYLPKARCEIMGDLAGIDRIAIIKR